MWAVDVKTGAISSAKADKRYEANHVLAKRTGTSHCCYVCVDHPNVEILTAGGLSEITFRNVTGTGSMQWLAFDYTVNNRNGKEHS